MKLVSITTAGEFAQALEDWIITNKCNPQTPEEWNKCIEDMLQSGILTPLGSIEDNQADEFKNQLKKDHNAKEL